MSFDLPGRPMLNRALRRVWRDHETVQLGVEPRHAVVVRGVTRGDEIVLGLLDGTRDVDALVTHAAQRGVDEVAVRRLLQTLARAQVLDDGAVQPGGNERERQRLEPDALTLALLDRSPGAAARALDARARASVVVHGAGRIGGTVVALLAAAGVGEVVSIDAAPVRAADLAPAAALQPSADSRAARLVRRADRVYGEGRVVRSSRRQPALAVVAPAGSMPSPEIVAAVRDLPHLFARVLETAVVVGPLVMPGRSACWRCVQLARADRDPAWPAIAAQLTGSAPAVEPGDVALSSLAASLAVVHALGWLDAAAGVSSGAVPSVNGTVELDLADGRLRRRSIAAHPDCGCGAAEPDALAVASQPRAG
ncbi:MAG TPA: TOMM precursor leader peptide-binding protein [Mycobacteriales bacterium]|nr:TOMM precursor leader peptide-binding protein [Mycobacteriales bacterium]